MSIISSRARRATAAQPGPSAPNTRMWQLACHEAGHVLLGMLEPLADQPIMASIFSRSCEYATPPRDAQREKELPGERYRRGRIIGLLGGLAAERVVFGAELELGGSDKADALAAARCMVAANSHSATQTFTRLVPPAGELVAREPDFHPPASGDELLERETQRVLAECLDDATTTLQGHYYELMAVARLLRTKTTAGLSEIRDAVAAGDHFVPAWPEGECRGVGRRRSFRLMRGSSPRGLTGPWDLLKRAPDPAPVTTPPPAPAAAPAVELAPMRHASKRVLTSLTLVRYWCLAAVWGLVTVTFWVWWLGQSSQSTAWLYWLQTTMLFYQTTLLPTIYWGFVRKMEQPVELEAPPGLRVALITLCVPAHESTAVILRQLDALVSVSYPHDSWILDEGDSPELRALAEERGVRYFTRRGVAAWNQEGPPFQRSTKAGNVNAWLDHVASLGVEYSAFVQFDIDHRPRPDYLERTLGYLRDPAVAWVQAPSVCGNLDNWAARGLTEQDLVFHGPLQMGFYGTSRTPFIIGSHTTYRTSAIREIGGFQPTRAEDHLDTVVLAAAGHQGVFVPDLIAVGDGPDGLATYLRQQFAWAFSMIQIFLHHMPALVRRYSVRQLFQFLFCQSWYTMWSISLALLWVLPTVALLIHRPIATVRVGDFLLYFVPVMLVSSLMWCETRRWFQPFGVKLSWRGIVLSVARWPVVLWAFLNVVFRVKRPYMITPKGQTGQLGQGAVIYGPGLALAGVPLAGIWLVQITAGSGGIPGYYGLVLLNAAIGLVVVGSTLLAELVALGRGHRVLAALRSRGGVASIVAGLTALLAVSTITVWHPMVQAIS